MTKPKGMMMDEAGKRAQPKQIAQTAMDNGHVPVFLTALCELLMCSDPWPASQQSEEAVKHGVNVMASKLGFSDWVEAYHGLCQPTDGVKERCPYCRGNGQMQVLDGGKHVEHPCICIYGVVPPSAFEWLSGSTPPSVASLEWMEGWDACRNRARTLLDKHIARGVQEVHHG